jgi:hypothetical protein
MSARYLVAQLDDLSHHEVNVFSGASVVREAGSQREFVVNHRA